MLKNGINKPSALNLLSSMQRSFTRNIRCITTATIIDKPDVYNGAMTEDKKKNASSVNKAAPLPKPAAVIVTPLPKKKTSHG